MKIKYGIVVAMTLIGLMIPSFSSAQMGPPTEEEYNCLNQPCMARDESKKKCVKGWIKLNTNVPFIGSCILMKSTWDNLKYSPPKDWNTVEVTEKDAFPILIGWLMQIITTTMLIVSFLLIVFAGVMMTLWGVKADWFNKGKWLIFKVAGVLALLGMSGIILKVINPSFFS